MADSFNVGDKVQLKSGGPFMTVESVETFGNSDTVECVWFNNDDESHRESLPAAALKKV